MPGLPNRFPPQLAENVVYEAGSGNRDNSSKATRTTKEEAIYISERKRRIESIARGYLEGRMPRLSSTSTKGPRHDRQLPPRLRSEAVSYETVPRTRAAVANAASDNTAAVESTLR